MVGEAGGTDHVLAQHPPGSAYQQFHAAEHGRTPNRWAYARVVRATVSGVLRAYISRTLVGAAAVLPVPVVAGDVPDPSAIYDNGQHVAVVTANGWAPSFRMYTSTDRSQWTLRGQVFKNPPKWVAVNMWAPEITKLSEGRYAVYYSARSKRGRDPWFCIGAAFAKSATGPYKDLGRPIRCGEEGSIDPYVLRDESGRRTLLFKNDGNEFQRPTSIWAQAMSEDGTSVSGKAKVIMRNDTKWEGGVIEGPSIVRAGGYFHMLYSGGLFGGTVGCDYALGTARSRTLMGEWEKFPGNPILKGGNGWSCPGHGSIYPGPSGTLDALYHAYPEGKGRLAGRQMIADTAFFSADNWLKVGTGTPPPRSPGAADAGVQGDLPRAPERQLGVAVHAQARHPGQPRPAADRFTQGPRPLRRRRDRPPHRHAQLHRRRRARPGRAARQGAGRHRVLPQRLRGHRPVGRAATR